MKEIRKKVINLATSLALLEVNRTGEDYIRCINGALDKACEQLKVSRKDFMRREK